MSGRRQKEQGASSQCLPLPVLREFSHLTLPTARAELQSLPETRGITITCLSSPPWAMATPGFNSKGTTSFPVQDRCPLVCPAQKECAKCSGSSEEEPSDRSGKASRRREHRWMGRNLNSRIQAGDGNYRLRVEPGQSSWPPTPAPGTHGHTHMNAHSRAHIYSHFHALSQPWRWQGACSLTSQRETPSGRGPRHGRHSRGHPGGPALRVAGQAAGGKGDHRASAPVPGGA